MKMIITYLLLFSSVLNAHNRYTDIPEYADPLLSRAHATLKKQAADYDHAPQTTVIKKEIWQQTGLLTVAEKLCTPQTAAGKITLTRLLLDPTTNVDIIKKRQAFLSFLVQNRDVALSISQHLKTIASKETEFLSFHDPAELFNQEEVLSAYDMISALKDGPAISTALNIGYLIKIVQVGVPAALAGIATLLAIANMYRPADSKIITPKQMAVARAASGILALLSAFNMHLLHKASFIPRYTLSKLCSIGQLLESIGQLNEICAKTALPIDLDTAYRRYQQQAQPSLEWLQHFLATSTTFQPAPPTNKISFKRFFFCDKGMIANGLLATKHSLPHLLDSYTLIGLLDAYTAVANLIHEQKSPYCFTNIITQNTTPILTATLFHHPLIDEKKSVKNSIFIGTNQTPRTIFINGVNTGGKSTLMEALTLCCILGQTIGIAPAQTCSLTPFSKINTCLHIVDDVRNNTSLFNAEIIRAHTLLYEIENTPTPGFCFTVLDEICRGTEHTEGEALTYAIAKKIGEYSHSISLFSSHFEGPLHLATEYPLLYKNMHVAVHVGENQQLIYPYLLYDGSTTQQIAADLLKKVGLPTIMVEKMRDVLNNPECYTPSKE